MLWFFFSIRYDRVHPLESGYFRLKFRRDRRPGLPLEPALLFYPKYVIGTLVKQIAWAALYLRMRMVYLRIKRDPRRMDYMDLALSPANDEETESRALFQSDAAEAYVRQEKRLDKIGRGEAA